MNNPRPALLLLSVTVTAMIVVLLTRGRGPEDDGAVWRPGASSEATQVALSGAADGLQVVARRRFASDDRQDFTDRSFAAALGMSPEGWTFLELLVANDREEPVRGLDPAALTFVADDGARVRGVDLRAESVETPSARLLLEVYAPPVARPLPARSMRRMVVAISSSASLNRLQSGSWLGVDLSRSVVRLEALEKWMNRSEPGARLLEAVLEPVADGAGDGR